jgi:hypothetical protein
VVSSVASGRTCRATAALFRVQQPLALALQPQLPPPTNLLGCRAAARAPALRPLRDWQRSRLLRAAGAKLFYLLRYPPDLNPIEKVFAKLKPLLRKTDPRTIETTWRGIGNLLDRFTPQECANYLVNAGYASA